MFHKSLQISSLPTFAAQVAGSKGLCTLPRRRERQLLNPLFFNDLFVMPIIFRIRTPSRRHKNRLDDVPISFSYYPWWRPSPPRHQFPGNQKPRIPRAGLLSHVEPYRTNKTVFRWTYEGRNQTSVPTMCLLHNGQRVWFLVSH
jgi:hypothetical protein